MEYDDSQIAPVSDENNHLKMALKDPRQFGGRKTVDSFASMVNENNRDKYQKTNLQSGQGTLNAKDPGNNNCHTTVNIAPNVRTQQITHNFRSTKLSDFFC